MKNTSVKNAAEILNKIENIEKEVIDLKLSILKQLPPQDKKVISLKGIIKVADITDKDIATAQQELYSKEDF